MVVDLTNRKFSRDCNANCVNGWSVPKRTSKMKILHRSVYPEALYPSLDRRI